GKPSRRAPARRRPRAANPARTTPRTPAGRPRSRGASRRRSPRRIGSARSRHRLSRHEVRRDEYDRLPMATRLERLAELAVHGANVQEGQILMVAAELGQEDLARAVAAAGYDRGAKFVDVVYFDPYLKRARVENADPSTLDFVPTWYGTRFLEHAEQQGARVSFSGPTAPNLLDGLDPALVGKDMLPRVKELTKIVSDRSTNWCIVPAPHPAWAQLVYPDLSPDDAFEKLWQELEHVLRLD